MNTAYQSFCQFARLQPFFQPCSLQHPHQAGEEGMLDICLEAALGGLSKKVILFLVD